MGTLLPTGPRGSLLAAGVTLLALALVWAAALDPLLGWRSALSEATANRGAVAARMAGVVETLPELRRQAQAETGGVPAAAALLEGSTDALAGAALQVRVRELATRLGVSLASVETLPAEGAGAFRRIGVRIAATEAWPILVGLLQAIEEASPRMLVDELQLQAALSITGATATRPLSATLTVFAFRTGTPAAPAGTP